MSESIITAVKAPSSLSEAAPTDPGTAFGTAPVPSAARESYAGKDLNLIGIIRSEWRKLRSLRSTVWVYGLLVVLLIGLGLIVGSLGNFGGEGLRGDAAGSAVVNVTTIGLNVAVLLIAALGSLTITGEYSTGMIRSTFAAVPSRIGAVTLKALVLAATTFVVTAVAIWVTAFVVWPILDHKNISVDLGSSSVFMPMLGGAVYVTLVALLAFGFGTILRSTAGSLATVLGLLIIAPVILQLLGGLTGAHWVADIGAFLPQNAGSQLYTFAGEKAQATTSTGGVILNGWGGFDVLAAWDAIVLGVALVQLKRRDA